MYQYYSFYFYKVPLSKIHNVRLSTSNHIECLASRLGMHADKSMQAQMGSHYPPAMDILADSKTPFSVPVLPSGVEMASNKPSLFSTP